ncbi:MAG: extracellular solute-binding protein [Lachnospiraceae bacterium]|nr:extracellular solute-binding protein [Lachnospiraceae bacterium]
MYIENITKIRKKVCLALVMLLVAAPALSACGKKSSEETPERAFGVDLIQELTVQSPEQVVCGSDGAWAITAQKNAPIYYLAYETETVGIETVEWQQEEGESLINIAERNGTLYAEVQSPDGDTLTIRKYGMGGWWNKVMDIEAEDRGWRSVGSGLFVDDAENVYLVSGSTVTRFGETGEKVCEYEMKGSSCFFQGQSGQYVECAAVGDQRIILYEMREKEAVEKWTLDVPVRCAYGIACSEEGTLCLATSEELLFVDKTNGKLLARSSYVMMGVSPVRAGVYNVEEETLRLYGTGESSAGNLFCGLLSGRDAAAQRTELVYGTLGTENREAAASIQAAIRDFNRENENYYITIRNYHSDTYDGTYAQRLHMDMASGNAPDIIEMDATLMYYESYVRNGYLEDLSPYLEQSKYGEDILWNVLSVYEMDGGLYLLAPHFNLNTFQVNPEYEIDVDEWNMETFLELIEENGWEKDILLAGTPQLLLYHLIAGQQNQFIDWEHKTAAFETEEFKEILALCGEYAARDWPDIDGRTNVELRRDSLCATDFFFSYQDYLRDVNVYGREYPLYGYPTSSGQVYTIGTCSDGCAMYAGSKNKEGAWEFMESLLGEVNQRCQNVYDVGFPIRESMMRELKEEGAVLTVDREEVTMTESEFRIVDNVLQSGEFTRTLLNYNIWVVIEEEANAYFAGDKSVEEVAHIIQSRVEIILNE